MVFIEPRTGLLGGLVHLLEKLIEVVPRLALVLEPVPLKLRLASQHLGLPLLPHLHVHGLLLLAEGLGATAVRFELLFVVPHDLGLGAA